MNTNEKPRYRVPTVHREAELDVSLDEFEIEDIREYLNRHSAAPVFDMSGSERVERLYYATRGDGPITQPLADDIRSLLRELAGRS